MTIPTLTLQIGLFTLAMALGLDAIAAQTSAAEIIEQARARARQIDEIKQVLNDPDQTVRLAAFEAMVGSGDPLMRELALDAGFASSDEVLRGQALKHAILGLEQLSITLSPDPAAPQAVQQRVQNYLEKTGASFILNIDTKDVDLGKGAFHQAGNASRNGNVSGLVVTFDYQYHTGELHLTDDNTLAGTINYSYGGHHQFKATAPIR
ncbi:MAG: hypothetical protein RIC56_14935 [Pseudomonadales bacterium]